MKKKKKREHPPTTTTMRKTTAVGMATCLTLGTMYGARRFASSHAQSPEAKVSQSLGTKTPQSPAAEEPQSPAEKVSQTRHDYWDGRGKCPIDDPFGRGAEKLGLAITAARRAYDFDAEKRLLRFQFKHLCDEYRVKEGHVEYRRITWAHVVDSQGPLRDVDLHWSDTKVAMRKKNGYPARVNIAFDPGAQTAYVEFRDQCSDWLRKQTFSFAKQ